MKCCNFHDPDNYCVYHISKGCFGPPFYFIFDHNRTHPNALQPLEKALYKCPLIVINI